MKSQKIGLFKIVARGTVVALLVKFLSLGILYLSKLFLARWLGVEEYGIYEYATALGLFLGFFAGMGFHKAVLRLISEYIVKQNWPELRGLIRASWLQTLAVSIAIAALGTGFIVWLNSWRGLNHQTSLILGLWLVPAIALMQLQKEMMRALKRIGLAYAPLEVLLPLLLLGIAWLWQQNHGLLTSEVVLVLSLLSLLLLVVIQLASFPLVFPQETYHFPPHYQLKYWQKISLSMLLTDSSFLIVKYTDTLMLGSWLGSQKVGIYSAAITTAAWVNFILVAVNAIAAPLFASLYAEENFQGLQKLVSSISKLVFIPAFLGACGLILFANPLLGLFGPEFVAAKWVLIALTLGQLVNVGVGSVGYLLTMTGHQKQSAKVMGWSATTNIVLNLICIPYFGILGAAIATAISMALWNLWSHRLVVNYLKIDPSIVAAWGKG